MRLEVAVLGRNVGESIVLRFGDDDWAVIDSFMSRNQPAASRFLEAVGVESRSVRFVVATHWDNDHVRGLSQVLEQAPEASFFYSNVADPERLRRLVAESRVISKDGWSRGADAFGDVVEVLRARGDVPKPVGAGTLLFRSGELSILAMSPTAAAVHAGYAAIGRELIAAASKATAATAVRPNLTSLAIWVETPEQRAVLGADLEAHDTFGWPAAIDETEDVRLPGEALILKVPHHGSAGADHPRLWNDLLGDAPHAAVTPYAPSQLPRVADVARLRTKTSQVLVIAGPTWSGRSSAALLQAAIPSARVDAPSALAYAHYVADGGSWTLRQGFL